MHAVLTVDEVRAAEQALMAKLPDGALMQRAAAGLAAQCARLLGTVYGARVTLLVGAGNNGGDALYAGARLAARGARVTALLLAPDRAHAGGLAALRRAGGRVAEAAAAAVPADLVVDGILGIGGSGGLREAAVPLADAARSCLTVAVDLPSGVDADTGAVEGEAVHADVTVTFGALKAGLVAGAGADHAGEVRLVDIGLELPEARTFVLEEADVRAALPVPGSSDDKYTRGVDRHRRRLAAVQRRRRALHRLGAARRRRDGALRGRRRRTRSAPASPKWWCTTTSARPSCGCRPGRPARAWAPTTRRWTCCATCCRPTSR